MIKKVYEIHSLKKSLIYFLVSLTFLCANFVFAQEENEENEKPVRNKNGVLITCGVERWSIKTLIDPDTTSINFNNVVPSSIAYQRSLTKPSSLPATRLPQEDTVFSITCKLVKYKLETDYDIHCVIISLTNPNDSMVAEIVDAECPGIAASSRYTLFHNLRAWFDSTYHPTTSFTNCNINIRITGVGFFDFLHGQTGIPANGREIHPILSFQVITTGIEPVSLTIPVNYKLYQNFPNPFNPETKIRFDVIKSNQIKLKIYDIQGKELETLINDKLDPGTYDVKWSGRNYPSGVYYYRIVTSDFTETKRMVLVK